jgi:hypothetical protein
MRVRSAATRAKTGPWDRGTSPWVAIAPWGPVACRAVMPRRLAAARGFFNAAMLAASAASATGNE